MIEIAKESTKKQRRKLSVGTHYSCMGRVSREGGPWRFGVKSGGRMDESDHLLEETGRVKEQDSMVKERLSDLKSKERMRRLRQISN